MSALGSMTLRNNEQMTASSTVVGKTTTARLPSSAHTKHNATDAAILSNKIYLQVWYQSRIILTTVTTTVTGVTDAPRLMRPVDSVLPEPRIILKDTYKKYGTLSYLCAHIIFIAEY